MAACHVELFAFSRESFISTLSVVAVALVPPFAVCYLPRSNNSIGVSFLDMPLSLEEPNHMSLSAHSTQWGQVETRMASQGG